MVGTSKLVAQKMRVPKMGEMIADGIRKKIILGEIAEGSILPAETSLMEEYGVSRPTLREAFRILEAESLITVTRGARGGAKVNTPNLKVASRYTSFFLQHSKVTLKEAYLARALLFPPAVRQLAEQASPLIVAKLRAQIDKVSAAVATDDAHKYAYEAIEFNDLLVRLAGNEVISAFASMVHDICQIHVEATLRASQFEASALQATVDAQLHLVDLIEKRNADEAEQYWKSHLTRVANRYVEMNGDKAIIDFLS